MTFSEIGLNDNILKAITDLGFETPTPIQQEAIPFVLAEETDLIALAQTGTGKTAAFGLPIIQKINDSRNQTQSIILCPTRELCLQITKDLETYSKYMKKLKVTAVYGGANIQTQIRALNSGSQIVVGTPGRVIDLINRKKLKLKDVEFVVLDEADEMLNMGFKDDLDTILAETPEEKQTLLFSATMPKKIRELANKLLKNPTNISLAISKPAAGITQAAYMCHDSQKVNLVREILKVKGKDLSHVLIFASSIKSVREIKKTLNKAGMRASEMHSGLEQEQREETIREFKSKKIRILVATDILSRGIDIKGIELVINYEVPHDAEDYVHRIGRTARADRTGEAITFINPKQVRNFMDIEKLIEKEVPKLNLPKRFEAAPKYQILPKEKKKKKWKNFKKKHH